MIIKFDRAIPGYTLDPMIVFQGMPIIVRLDGITLSIRSIERDGFNAITCYNNSQDAWADFERINIALSYNQTDNPEMFL